MGDTKQGPGKGGKGKGAAGREAGARGAPPGQRPGGAGGPRGKGAPPPAPQGRRKGGGEGRGPHSGSSSCSPSRSRLVLFFLIFLGLGGLAALALDLQTIGTAPQRVAGLRPGDRVLLDRFSAELGRVAQGEVVALRTRGKAGPGYQLRQVLAVAGERARGRTVERGHLLVDSSVGARGRAEEVPLGDVLAVARLRIREKGERWLVDFL